MSYDEPGKVLLKLETLLGSRIDNQTDFPLLNLKHLGNC